MKSEIHSLPIKAGELPYPVLVDESSLSRCKPVTGAIVSDRWASYYPNGNLPKSRVWSIFSEDLFT